MAGYDVKRLLESLDWLIDGPSFGTIYSTLHDLLRDELVTVEVEHRQSKPLRKVYSITDAGRRVLEKWVSEPAVLNGSLRAFAMRLILADNFAPDALIAHLQQRRDQVAEHETTLEETARALDEKTDFQRLALEYGFALVTAELAWLDNTLNRLLRQPLLMEVAQGN